MESPEVVPPPQLPPQLPPIIQGVPGAPPPPPQAPQKPKNVFQKAWAAFVAFVVATWKWIYLFFKLAKGAKLLITAGSMLVTIGVYSVIFGWKFAAGFVICVLIHELGHVFAAWRLKYPVSAPIFIPGMGALILLKSVPMSGWHSAIIGIGGPAFGALSALACWGIYFATGSQLFLGLAYFTFFINLFNMMPMYPLDGGRITGAVSPYIWVFGMVGLVAMLFTGYLTNPFIWLLLILSLPQVVQAFKRGTLDQPGYTTTRMQKTIMGLSYVGLSGVLLGGVILTLADPNMLHAMPRRTHHVQASPN